MRGAAALVALACIVLTACGPFHRLGPAVAHVTPDPVASSARVASSPRLASPPLPSPSALPSPTGSSNAPCDVPVAYISEAYGWFIHYPGGGLKKDPSSTVALPGNQPGAVGMNPGLTYDRPAHVWVPVPYFWLAPSGGMYAYWDSVTGEIKGVSVPQGKVQVLAPSGWILVGVSDAGAYVWGPSGAFLLPFDGGPMVKVAPKEYWFGYRDNVLWGVTGYSNGTVLRLDLATGKQTTLGILHGWYDFAGFDGSGNPLFKTSNDVPTDSTTQPYGLEAVYPGGRLVSIWQGHGYSAGGYSFGDAHGVWFMVGNHYPNMPLDGLYLWRPGQGAKRIVAADGNLSGPCA